MKRIKYILLLPILALVIGLSTNSTYASSSVGDACGGIHQLGGSCSSTTSNKRVNDLATKAINILSYIIGIVAVVVIIIAGFRFITASGDANTISSARTQLIYAIIGIIIVVIAQLIAHIALKTANSVSGDIWRIAL